MNHSVEDRFTRLLAFADDVLAVCESIGIDPILDGSLAVRTHTGDPSVEVRDIDLNCPESEFPRLKQGLDEADIFNEIQPWHVLQARRDGLKVEFGAIDVWMHGLEGPHDEARLENHVVRMVNRETLRELYQRGFDATAENPEEREKHERIASKLRLLDGA